MRFHVKYDVCLLNAVQGTPDHSVFLIFRYYAVGVGDSCLWGQSLLIISNPDVLLSFFDLCADQDPTARRIQQD